MNVILSALLFITVVLVVIIEGNEEFTLNLLHLNDFHARFEQTSVFSGRCAEKDAEQNKCYGGFARLSTKLKEIRSARPNNTLFISAGDYYQGTMWYTIHKYKPLAEILNLIKQDVMVLGNHEFDDNIEGIVPFLENVTFPVLACNIDDSLEPTFQGKVLPSIILELGGRKVGIIGYVTTETHNISSPGKLKITDEIDAIRQEVQKMKSAGVDIIIAVGHAGFDKDLQVARDVEEVDVVVGGHTNTFLYTGDESPSTESINGEYPHVITQASGRKVPVVQAYAFGKYLGHLEVTFDNRGEVVRWSGNPILMDASIPQDPIVLNALKPWKMKLQSIAKKTIGKTNVHLEGNSAYCRLEECNMGNLIADGIVHQNAKHPDDVKWARASLAVINGGGIRASISEGMITLEDVMTVTPFRNTIDIVELKGHHVKLMFEHAIAKYDPKGVIRPGEFLQVSGFQVTYDINRSVGDRVVNLKAKCVQCRVPKMEPVKDEEIYMIALPSFIVTGGDGYSVIRDNIVKHHRTGLLDSDVLSEYIRGTSPIIQGIEGRILFESTSTKSAKCSDSLPSHQMKEQNMMTVPETMSPKASVFLKAPSKHEQNRPHVLDREEKSNPTETAKRIQNELRIPTQMHQDFHQPDPDGQMQFYRIINQLPMKTTQPLYRGVPLVRTRKENIRSTTTPQMNEGTAKQNGGQLINVIKRLINGPESSQFNGKIEPLIIPRMKSPVNGRFLEGPNRSGHLRIVEWDGEAESEEENSLEVPLHPEMIKDFYDPDPDRQKLFYISFNKRNFRNT